jgi:hypothetical protein
MGNLAIAEELTASEELDELYRLVATETDPEEGEDGEDEELEDDGEEEAGGARPTPQEIPHD